MAVGRISGPLLKANLLRNGVDLAFETDLLYLDVKNLRIGVKTNAPTHDLHVNGTTRTTTLEATNQLDIGNITMSGTTIQTSDPQLTLTATGGLDPVVYQKKIVVDNLDIVNNSITINTPDTDLELAANGTGLIKLFSDTLVNGDLHATGTITADGDITIGDSNTDNISFNADISSNILPDLTTHYTLGDSNKRWNEAWSNVVYADTVNVSSSLTVDGLNLGLRPGNTLYVSLNGNDSKSGTHQSDPFLTVRHALSVATEGTTIYIYPGQYQEIFPLIVPVGVTVKGAGIRAVKIIPTTDTRYNDAFILNGETTVEDLTVADFFSNGNYFTVTSSSNNTLTFNAGTSPFAHTYVSGGTVTFNGNTYSVTGATYTYTTGVTTITYSGPAASGQVFVSNLTFSCAGSVGSSTRIFPDNGYGFRFSTNFTVTSRSPYVRNVSVITKGSVTSITDPLGFDSGDAGKGAYIDGAYANATSKEASMLFHGVTMITPGVDALTATNGVRVEWLNCFTYYAKTGLKGITTNKGFAQQGKTQIRLDGVTGTFAAGQTLTYYSTYPTVLGSGTISSVSNDGKIFLTGNVTGLQTAQERGGKTITGYGDAKLSTSVKKWGTASLSLDGVGDYITVDSNNDFAFGSGDFTIEFWAYRNSNGGSQAQFDFRTTSGTASPYLYAAGTSLVYSVAGVAQITTATGVFNTLAWHHIALSRNGLNTRLFVNGVQVGIWSNDTTVYVQGPAHFGANYAHTANANQYFDDIRITKGLSRYNAGFTAPTSAFTNDSHTVLLSHFNGTDGSTTFVDETFLVQDIRSNTGATASKITLVDHSDFGVELRSIASACIYGTYGATGDGAGVTMYLIGQNFAYIGTGKRSDNDPTYVIQANETVETNGAHIYYSSVDHKGDYRVGDLFYVNQQTGEVTFTSANFNIDSSQGLTFTNGSNVTYIDGNEIDTGNLKLSGNTLESTTGPVNILSANDQINLLNNVSISGNLDVVGNVTIGGNIQIGDQLTDTINFVGGINSNLVPNITNTYDIGTSLLKWKDLYANRALVGNISVTSNQVTTTVTNSNLELIANGTGYVALEGIVVQDNEIRSTSNSDLTLAPNGTGIVNINSNQSLKVPVGTSTERPGTPQTGMIRFNTTVNRYEGWNGTNWVYLDGLSDLDGNTKVTAELTPGANDNTIRFYADGTQVADVNSTRFNITKVAVDDIEINGTTISNVAGGNLTLQTSPSGQVLMENFSFNGNTITNTSNNAVTTISATGDGYVKIEGSGGFVVPSGASIYRPGAPVLGMMRFDTTLGRMEVYDGTTWVSVAGAATGISKAEAEELAVGYALMLG